MSTAAARCGPQHGPGSTRLAIRTHRSPPWRSLLRRRDVLAWLAMSCAGIAAPTPTRAQQIEAHVAVASDYVVHGLSRSQGDPTLQAQLGLDLGNDWAVGASAATMNLNPGPGPSRELALYVSRTRSLARDWTLAASLSTYLYAAQIPGLSYDYSAARIDLSWRERLQLGLAVSPDYSVGTRRGVSRNATSIEYSLTWQQPLSRSVAITAGVGQFDLSDGLGLRFVYWSAGAIYTGRRLSLAVTWAGAGRVTRTMFNDAATGDRLIATLSWRLL